MSIAVIASPIRAGAFDDPDEVAAAIEQLHAARFRSSEIRVVTSDPDAAGRFAAYIQERPAGARTGNALSGATMVYVALAVIGVGALLFSSGTTTLIVASMLLGVALLVTFGSIMMTRGAERELSDYYSQGVIPGQVLLAVELGDNAPRERRDAADRIFERFTGSHAALDRE